MSEGVITPVPRLVRRGAIRCTARTRSGVAALATACFVVAGGSLADTPPGQSASADFEAALAKLPLPPPVEQLAVVSETRMRGRAAYLPVLTREAQARGLPPAVADAVATVESGYQAAAVGGVGEVGIMQVRPTTAAMLGHKGSAADLFVPETNIRFGVTYLARAWQLAGGDLCRALMKYRAGHGEERMTPLSVEYCRRARVHLASIGSPLAGAPLPVAGTSAAPAPARPTPGGAERVTKVSAPTPVDPARERMLRETRRLWAEHVERVRKIDANIGRIMGTTGPS
jgi:hypothetical protein